MSRSGYIEDDDDQWRHIRWRGMVASATRGKRGQEFFHSLINALDAMPVKELIADVVEDKDGQVCALGALGKHKGLDMSGLTSEEFYDDYEAMSAWAAYHFNIADCLAREVVYVNDEIFFHTPSERWQQMRKWAESQINK
jgi:hypothetical protein